jgi:hypothetical protein
LQGLVRRVGEHARAGLAHGCTGKLSGAGSPPARQPASPPARQPASPPAK